MDMNNFYNMCDWEQEKALYLIRTAKQLGMNISGYGELAVNQTSGYTYLWLEDYPFTLYMPISCELEEKDVWVMWINPENGEEIEKSLDEFSSLSDIKDWCKNLDEENKQS